MIEFPEIVDPAACRRRAQRCREQALRSTIAGTELTDAADTWEELARHAQNLREAVLQAKASAKSR